MLYKRNSTKHFVGLTPTVLCLLSTLLHLSSGDYKDVYVSDQNCPHSYEIFNPDQKYKIFLKTDDCETCAEGQCPSFRRKNCKVTVSVKGYLAHGYKVCIDLSYITIENCTATVNMKASHQWLPDVRHDCSPKRKLFSITTECSTDQAEMVYEGWDFCPVKGHATARLDLNSDVYDLLPHFVACPLGTEYVRGVSSGKIISSSRWSEEDTHKPCILEIESTSFYYDNKFCITFDLVHFSKDGPKLVIANKEEYTVNEKTKLEYSAANLPQLKTEKCIKVKGLRASFTVQLIPRDNLRVSKFDHEFVMRFSWRKDTTDWWNKDDDNDVDTSSSDSEEDTSADFQKKMLIAGAVVIVAIFLCCYYGCSKGKKYGSTQEPETDPGLGDEVVHTPFYEAEPLTNDRGRETPSYTHPSQNVVIDTPIPRQTDASSASAAAADQLPPSYANLAPAAPVSPTAPPAPGDNRYSQTSHSSAPPVPPPAYESLFPDRG